MSTFFLRSNVHRRISVDRILNQGSVQMFRICARKAAVASPIPLHWSSYSVAISQIDVVSHSNFVAVIDDRSARQRHQHAIHQLDAPAVVFEQRSEPPPNPQV